MNPDLFTLKELIFLFRNELANLPLEEYPPLNFGGKCLIEPSKRAEAYSWICLETKYAFFLSASEETIKKYKPSACPEILLKEASEFRAKWGMKTIKVSGCKAQTAKIKEIYKYKDYGIFPPKPSELLIEYLERLSNERNDRKIWRESLGGFLQYLRDNTPPECHGFIDIIFPRHRALYEDRIVRLIRKDKFPTNIIVVSQILKHLSEELLWGDPRAQHGAAETLAFAWLCLISARLRLPSGVELLQGFNPLSLMKEEISEKEQQEGLRSALSSNKYLIKIPTLFGDITTEISKLHFDYFSNLFLINQKLGAGEQFLLSTERSLRKTFARAVSKLKLPPKHGNITFLTFTSWPTENLHYRSQIDNSRYTSKVKKP